MKDRYRSINSVLIHFTQLTKNELAVLPVSDQLDLIKLAFLPYILNGYADTDFQVPSRLSEVWERCKSIIEKEAGR